MRTSLSDLVIDPSRLRDRPAPRTWKDIPIVEPTAVQTAHLRWVAVRTAPKCERLVAAELTSLGYTAYCPLGAKFVLWQGTKRSKNRLVKQFPVFCRYIFVGLKPYQAIGKYIVHGRTMVLAEKIQSILSDSQGPLIIPHRAVAEINARELTFQWDETKRSPFKIDNEIRIISGPLRDFYATVDDVTSEGRIRALLTIFGRKTIATLDVADVEVV